VTGRHRVFFIRSSHNFAAIAGQGFALCSDVLTERDLACGALVKALDISLPGYNFDVTHVPGTARQRSIDAFSAWIGGRRTSFMMGP
jgi:DNA-binding transcriptional LysR family regulator